MAVLRTSLAYVLLAMALIWCPSSSAWFAEPLHELEGRAVRKLDFHCILLNDARKLVKCWPLAHHYLYG
jgi:hypothetical protein